MRCGKERVVSCGLADDLESGSDHRPIRLVLALETTTYTPPPRRAFRRTDPAILERAFLDTISRLPTSPLLTPADVDERADRLTEALQIAISAATPFARTRAGRVVPWWDEELAQASKAARHAANQAFRLRGTAGREAEGEVAWREKRRARNEMKKLMRSKREVWEEKEMASVTEATLWKTVKKRISESHVANTTTPPLRKVDGTYATSALDKLDLLRPLLLPTVTPNSSNAPAPSQLPAASPQTRPPPARNPDISTSHWTEPQLAKAADEMRVSGAQVSPEFVVHPATREADNRHESEPKRTSTDPNQPTTTATRKLATMEEASATTRLATMAKARSTARAARTRTARKKGEGGGEGKSKSESVPEGEERQQVRSHRSYRNPQGATRTSPDGVEARAREEPFNPAELAADAPEEPTPSPLPWPELHECEVESAIMQARPFAACGPDDVPNHALQLLLPHLLPHLVPLYRASLALGHLPRSWRDASCVVLRKPKKPDYRDPRAYRMIAFERCVAKGLERVVAARLSYLAESHGLLPPSHFGGRRRRSAEDAIVCVVDEIKGQWRSGNAIVGLALDVSKAFPSVQKERLTANLKARGLVDSACAWIESFLSDRSCTLQLEGVVSESIEWTSGLPQGSPLSPILFLAYNAPLLESCATTTTCGFGWIDDVNILAWGKTVEEAVSAMNSIVPRLESWSDSHSSAFEPAKTEATIFLPAAREIPKEPPRIVLRGHRIEFKPTLTMLGSKLDSQLSFRPHVASCASRASVSASAIALLTRSKAGLAPKLARQLVVACVVPRLLWAGAAWYEPAKGRDRTKELARVLKTAAMAVTGGFRSAAGEALEVDAGILPIHLQLDRAVFRLGLRALSATPSHPLHTRISRARRNSSTCHPSPLDRALSFPLLHYATVEPIHPDPIPPWSPGPAPPVTLARGKELGTHEHCQLVKSLPAGSLLVYSDGSMGDSGVVGAGIAGRQWDGTSKVVLEEGEEVEVEEWEARSKGLGQHQTVYAGELAGIHLALQAVQHTADPPSHVLLSVDNTAALTHSTDPSPTSDQHLRLAIRRTFEELQRTCVSRIILSWSPGHVGVAGNEAADLAAKEAVREMESAEREREQRRERKTHLKGRLVFVPEMAELSDASEEEDSEWEEVKRGGRSSSHLAKSGRLTQPSDDNSPGLGLDTQLPLSTSALWTAHKRATRARWDDEWRRSAVGRQLFAASQLASRSARYYDGLSRRQSTLLCRLRTGASALNAYRAKFDATRDPLCSCGEEEDREHLLLTCPLYDNARHSLLQHLRLRKLPTAGQLLGNPSYRDPILDFLDRTGRFPRLAKAQEAEKREKE